MASGLESSDEDDVLPLKKCRRSVPAPPPVMVSKLTIKVRKGQGNPVDVKKAAREQVMARLQQARAIAAATINSHPSHP